MLTTPAKLALSFACAFLGWSAGLAWYVGWSVFGPGFGYLTDFESIAAWSALCTFAAWAMALVPIALRVSEERAVFRLPWSVPFGAVCGVALCAAYLAPTLAGVTLLFGQPMFLGQAAIVGGVSWSTYAAVAKRGWPSRPIAIAGFLLPPLGLGALQFALWPAFERSAPAVAYRIGTDDARHRIFERTLRELQVGDSIEMLRERLPGEFQFETTRTTGNRGPHLSYTIEFADGRVTNVELVEKP